MRQTHTTTYAKTVALLAALTGTAILSVTRPMAQPSSTAVFTTAQADAGRATYKGTCASCHTPDLGGREDYPQLAGPDFIGAWKTRTTKDLYEFIQATMPPEGPMLKPEQALGLVAFIMQENGATAGTTALTESTAAPIGTIATGKRPGR
jgi:mono/diheme cytochrome c family protein